jgi:hypothetical protein
MSAQSSLMRLLGLLAGLLLVGSKPPVSPGEEPAARQLPPAVDRTVDYQRDVRPILARSCTTCHGAEMHEGGLRLHTRKALLRGGDHGAALVVGRSAESRLILYVAGANDEGLLMPPEGEGRPLTAEEIGVLRAWIDQGAKGPDEEADTIRTSHWAFQPIGRPVPPHVRQSQWVRNPIDAFVLARLESQGIEPSAEADRATLLRRVYLDLLGLPPSPSELEAFLNDPRPDAYELVVERLLADPAYGERWGRHWLDLARYADSDGYEKDLPRPHAWRYRQWVIDALNADMPYDEFTLQQLAGDLIAGASSDCLAATGFHRNTLTNREGGVDREEDRVKQTVDRTNTTGTVWLGLTMGCAQCHSHKYDPISQREYYGLYAFFNSLEERDIPAWLYPWQEEQFRDQLAAWQRKETELREALQQYTAQELARRQAAWEDSVLQDSSSGDAGAARLPAAVASALATARPSRSAAQQKAIDDYYRSIDPELKRWNDALAAHGRQRPQPSVQAQTLYERNPPRETRVLMRGDFLQPGDAVEPHTPQVLPPLEASGGRPTRLDLVRWLFDPQHPLTARVAVNRVWQRYFGQGLVESSHDFGTQGTPPSHPELLDWLASEFRLGGWSFKKLHRLIVTSATYRQSSRNRPELKDLDPYNRLLARQNRLRVEAEVVRDLALAASGLLEPRIGGESVRPPQPADVAALGYAGSVKWVESRGADRYRRGLYTFFQRTVPYPMFMDFDAPDANECCTRRERSNTPLGALTLQNDPVFVECAQAFARRLMREVGPQGDVAQRVRLAFRLAVGRDPTPHEVQLVGRLHDDALACYAAQPELARAMAGNLPRPSGAGDAELAAWAVVGRTLLNLDEFITRE